jgi:hypothetical protein
LGVPTHVIWSWIIARFRPYMQGYIIEIMSFSYKMQDHPMEPWSMFKDRYHYQETKWCDCEWEDQLWQFKYGM